MSVTLYDLAIKNKIQKWIIDPNVKVMGTEDIRSAWDWRDDQLKDKPFQLPFVCVTRRNPISIKITAKRPKSFEGKVYNADQYYVDHLNAIPITISYQLDVYTRYLNEADEYIRNFVFNIINYPSIDVIIPYNGADKAYRSFMRINQDINDNSDIPERLVPGQFSRMTLGITLDDAYLFSYSKKHPVVIDGNVVTIGDKNETEEQAAAAWDNPSANVITIKINQENIDA